jgi:hypothetical protein
VSIFGANREPPTIVLHQDVVDVSRTQVQNSPEVETGGKFLGYVVPSASKVPRSPYGDQVAEVWREMAAKKPCLFIVASMSSGPRAKCTATSLIPDGEFQATVFRTLERQEPELEHLGSWHSHHPNSLREFSAGDVAHYESVIIDRNYGPAHFVAGLCNDASGLRNGVFELYSRKGVRRIQLAAGLVLVMDSFPSLQRTVASVEAQIKLGEAVHPLEAALRNAFAIRERRIDADSVSWIIQARSGSRLLGVVTETKGAEPHIAVSLEVSGGNATLQYDTSGSHAEIEELIARLLNAVGDIERAVQCSGRRG